MKILICAGPPLFKDANKDNVILVGAVEDAAQITEQSKERLIIFKDIVYDGAALLRSLHVFANEAGAELPQAEPSDDFSLFYQTIDSSFWEHPAGIYLTSADKEAFEDEPMPPPGTYLESCLIRATSLQAGDDGTILAGETHVHQLTDEKGYTNRIHQPKGEVPNAEYLILRED